MTQQIYILLKSNNIYASEVSIYFLHFPPTPRQFFPVTTSSHKAYLEWAAWYSFQKQNANISQNNNII